MGKIRPDKIGGGGGGGEAVDFACVTIVIMTISEVCNSKVFMPQHNYLGVMVQALEGDCIELAMVYTAEWIGLPSLNEKQKQAVVPSWMKRVSLSAYLQDLGS